jgi:hypothetical protein
MFVLVIFRNRNIIFRRNNLTIIESILLRGEGGIGGLEVGSSTIPIVIEISANQYNLCSSKSTRVFFEIEIFGFFLIRSRWKSSVTKNIGTSKYRKYANHDL